jgi:hypothetical protein
LQKLYKFCQEQDLKLGGSDLIRVVCRQCGQQEVCPSTLIDEYDAEQSLPVIDAAKKKTDDSAM